MHALTLFTPSKLQHGFDSYHNGHYYFGIVQSNSAKRLPAIIVNKDSEQWHIVNLKHSNRFDAVAVLGAFDDDEATDIALQHYGNHFDAVASGDVCVSHTQGLKRYLDSPYANMGNRPVFKAEMDSLQSVLVGHRIEWDGIELKSHGGQCGNLLTDMVKHDDNRLLLEKYDGITAYLKELGDVELVEFDSFIVDNVRLEQTMNKLLNAMNRASGQGVQVRSFSQSKPVKLRQTGAIQVAVSFELVDGQNVTIIFNHADAETAKLGIKDALFAWKYKLNSRDISAAVQPNNAVDVKIDQIAIRIMKLANANSARFVRSQAKKDENKQALADGEVRISDKQAGIVALNTEIADLQKQIDGWQPSGVGEQSKDDTSGWNIEIASVVDIDGRDELQPIENNATSDKKTIGDMVAVIESLGWYESEKVQTKLSKKIVIGNVSSGIEHNFSCNKSNMRSLFSLLSMKNIDTMYSSLIGDTDSAKWFGISQVGTGLAFNKKVDVNLYLKKGYKVTGLEVIPRKGYWTIKFYIDVNSKNDVDFAGIDYAELLDNKNQVKENSPIVLTRDAVSEQMQKYSLQEYSALLAKRLEQLGLLEDYKESLLLGDDNKKSGDLMLVAAKDLQKTDGIISLLYGFRDTFNELRNMLKPIVLTGKELGDFPDTPEGKKALREAAKVELVALRGKSIYCPALKNDVDISREGVNKITSFSGDIRKLKIVAAIQKLISVSEKIDSEKPYDDNEIKKGIVAYHILRSSVQIDDSSLFVRFIIKEKSDGHFQYDYSVGESESIFDSVAKENASQQSEALSATNYKSATQLEESLLASNQPNVPTHKSITPQADNLVNEFDAAGQKYVLNLFIEGEDDVGIEQPEPPVENKPVEQPMNEQQADIDYLNSILSGEIDFATADLDELESKLEAINDRLTPETEPLFEQVADAFAAYAIALEV